MKQFVTVTSAKLEEITLYNFIKERIIIDEDKQAIIKIIQDKTWKIKIFKNSLQLQDAKVKDDLI